MTINGTVKTISIVLITVIAIGSIICGFERQSGNLTRVVEDVAVIEAAWFETAGGLTDVEKAVILIQNNMGHMKDDIAEILALLQKRSPDKSE